MNENVDYFLLSYSKTVSFYCFWLKYNVKFRVWKVSKVMFKVSYKGKSR